MDMSFSFDEATPLAVRGLGYAELLALVRDRNGIAKASDDARALAGARAAPPRTAALATTLLADVLLGRPGWRAASLALGGCFMPAPPGIAPSNRLRKPV